MKKKFPTSEEILENLRKEISSQENNEEVYDISDFLKYEDIDFITNAYRIILKREPDPEGLKNYLQGLRKGIFSKLYIIASLRYSEEGRKKAVPIKGLNFKIYLFHKIRRIFFTFLKLFFPFFSHEHRISILEKKIEDYQSQQTMRLSTLEQDLQKAEEKINQNLQAINENISHTNILENRIEQINRELSNRIDDIVSSLNQSLQKQVSEITNKIDNVTGILAKRLQEQSSETQTLKKQLQELNWYFSVFSKSLDISPKKRKEKEVISNNIIDSFYFMFEDAFRGKREDVKESFKCYIPILKEAVSKDKNLLVIDLGCGRGEWLELLRDEGIRAIGVDINKACVEECRKHNLYALHKDLFDFLKSQSNKSISVITAFHLIEHLPYEQILRLLLETLRVLKPDGIAIFETPNPRNILVSSGDFFRDLTHIRPVFPDTLVFLAEKIGFKYSEAFFFDEKRTKLISFKEFKFSSLEDYINVSRDYAWIGRK